MLAGVPGCFVDLSRLRGLHNHYPTAAWVCGDGLEIVWTSEVASTGAQDAALPPAARVSSGTAGPASEAGRLHGGHRSDPPRGSGPAEEATAHGQADRRALTRGVWLHGRRHDCQSLRARAAAERAGDVCAAGTSAGRRAGRLRRSAGGHRRGRVQGALPGRRSAAQRRRVRAGVSGRDDGGVL